MTERFLAKVDEAVHTILSDSSLGQIVGTNYKSFFIQTPLTEAEFEQRILVPIKTLVMNWYEGALPHLRRRLHAEGISYIEMQDWPLWIEKNVLVASGANSAEANINLNLKRHRLDTGQNLDIQTWRQQLVEAREILIGKYQLQNADIQYYLGIIRKLKRTHGSDLNQVETNLTEVILGSNHLELESALIFATQLLSYYNLLSQADYIPVFEGTTNEPSLTVSEISFETLHQWPWRIRRHWVTMKSLPFVKNVIASDGVGFGNLALWSADAWVRSGAQLESIGALLAEASHLIEATHQVIIEVLGQTIDTNNKDLFLSYRSGDDALFMLSELTEEQIKQINLNLKSLATESHSRLKIKLGDLEAQMFYRFSQIVPVIQGTPEAAYANIELAIEKARFQIK